MIRDMKRGVRTRDEFQVFMEKTIKFIVKHRETSIWIGVGIIIGIALLFYFGSAGEEQKPEADLLFTQAVGLITMGKFQDAENTFLQLTEKFPKTRSGKIGLYYLGAIYYNTGRFEETIKYFDKFLSKEKNDYLLTPSALYGAGCAAEGLKDYNKALEYYKKIIKNRNSAFYFEAMLAYGRINGTLGDSQKAREILKELLKQNPPVDIVNNARFYLGYFNE